MTDDLTPQVSETEGVPPINSGDSGEVSLESLVMLVNATRLNQLQDKIDKEFKELKDRQAQVRALHNLMKKINSLTNTNGELDCSSNDELKKLLADAKDMGVDIQDGKYKYTKDERDRLVENVRMTIEDLNVMNDMQLQTVNRLTNERYESYQLARSILKPLHEAKMQSARSIK